MLRLSLKQIGRIRRRLADDLSSGFRLSFQEGPFQREKERESAELSVHLFSRSASGFRPADRRK